MEWRWVRGCLAAGVVGAHLVPSIATGLEKYGAIPAWACWAVAFVAAFELIRFIHATP